MFPSILFDFSSINFNEISALHDTVIYSGVYIHTYENIKIYAYTFL